LFDKEISYFILKNAKTIYDQLNEIKIFYEI